MKPVSITGRSAARADRLSRETGDKIEPPSDPAGECVISRIPGWLDADEAGQDPAAEEHRPYVRLAQCLLAAVSTDPDHQCGAGYATAHVAVDQERQAADHPAFPHVVAAG